jgi:hypothetical protein
VPLEDIRGPLKDYRIRWKAAEVVGVWQGLLEGVRGRWMVEGSAGGEQGPLEDTGNGGRRQRTLEGGRDC